MFLALILMMGTSFVHALRNDVLDKSVDFMGGTEEFLALQNVLYDFVETRYTDSGPVSTSGRHFFEFRKGRLISGQTESHASSDHVLALLKNNKLQLWVNGQTVGDPALIEKARQNLVNQVFCLLIPHNVKLNNFPVKDNGLDYFLGTLCWVIEVDGDTAMIAPGLKKITMYLDPRSHLVRGISFLQGDSLTSVAYKDYDISNNLILSAARDTFRGGKAKATSFTLLHLRMNVSPTALAQKGQEVSPSLLASMKTGTIEPSVPPVAKSTTGSSKGGLPPVNVASIPGVLNALPLSTDMSPPDVVPVPAPEIGVAPPATRPVLVPQFAPRAKRKKGRALPSQDIPKARRQGRMGVLVSLDMVDDGDKIQVVANVPGVQEANVHVFVLNKTLMIRGLWPSFSLKSGQTLLSEGRPKGNFVQELQLPFDVVSEKLESKVQNGILIINIPKKISSDSGN